MSDRCHHFFLYYHLIFSSLWTLKITRGLHKHLKVKPEHNTCKKTYVVYLENSFIYYIISTFKLFTGVALLVFGFSVGEWDSITDREPKHGTLTLLHCPSHWFRSWFMYISVKHIHIFVFTPKEEKYQVWRFYLIFIFLYSMLHLSIIFHTRGLLFFVFVFVLWQIQSLFIRIHNKITTWSHFNLWVF
mgnify:CR=1 FL=1